MKKKEKAIIKPYIKAFFKKNHLRFLLVIFGLVIDTAVSMFLNIEIKEILDFASGGSTLHFSTLLFEAILILSLVISEFIIIIFVKPVFIEKAMAQYKEQIFSGLLKKEAEVISESDQSLFLSSLSNDLQVIETGYLNSTFNLILLSMLFVSSVLVMLVYSPVLTLIAVSVSFLPMGISFLTARKAAPFEKQVSIKNEAYTRTLNETLSGLSVIRSFQAEKQIFELFKQKIEEVQKAKTARRKVSAVIQMLSRISGLLVQVGVLLIGAFLAISQISVTVGTVMTFTQLVYFVLEPINTFPELFAQRKASYGLIEKMAMKLSEDQKYKEGILLEKLNSGITVQNLTYSYDGREVLKNLNIHFEKGKSYVITGTSGSGKTTLLKLLSGAIICPSDSIFYDNVSQNEIGGASLAEMISEIEQNAFIFNASIRDNITLFSEFSNEEIERAIHLSGLAELVRDKGENYLCGENGSGLSGGERKRISIARSLLKKSEVLLADEATASLDREMAFMVEESILNLKDMLRITVTHMLDEVILKRYDEVLTLKDGEIIECGSFDELMEKKGYFYSLYTVSN